MPALPWRDGPAPVGHRHAGPGGSGCRKSFGVAPPPEVPFGRPFRREMVVAVAQAAKNTEQHYGALARDGSRASCAIGSATQALGQERSYTGNFVTGPPNEINGPYETVVSPRCAMPWAWCRNSGRRSPAPICVGPAITFCCRSSTTRGTAGFSYEQTTHLEWQNSDLPRAGRWMRSCQDCHMPTHYKGQALSFKIANNESSDFAPTTHRLPDKEIQLTERSGIPPLPAWLERLPECHVPAVPTAARHPPDRLHDRYGRGAAADHGAGLDARHGQNETASVTIDEFETTPDGKLRAVVTVTNKVGHYLPSGVGFRRVFLEFLVWMRQDNVLWASGRTNALGAILDGITDQVLAQRAAGQVPADFQPHYQSIDSGDQVQIYEELHHRFGGKSHHQLCAPGDHGEG